MNLVGGDVVLSRLNHVAVVVFRGQNHVTFLYVQRLRCSSCWRLNRGVLVLAASFPRRVVIDLQVTTAHVLNLLLELVLNIRSIQIGFLQRNLRRVIFTTIFIWLIVGKF